MSPLPGDPPLKFLGKFHPSQRTWPEGMPESIAQTEYVRLKCAGPSYCVVPDCDHADYSPLNLVDVYCPNTGCKWHVKVDEKVREYILEGHLRACPIHHLREKPAEAVGDEESILRDKSLAESIERVRTAPTPERHPNSRRFHELLEELGDLHDLKSADYGRGDDPFANVRSSEEWGLAPWVGAMVRLNDKVRRLQSLFLNGDLKNEAAEDSFRDIAVYAIIALVLYEQGLQDGRHTSE